MVITKLEENEIFVFGSNTIGRHGKGAALFAKINFGAINGVGEGIQGKSYGIPTKGSNMSRSLLLEEIEKYVINFILYAEENPHKVFLVTEIGCGLAGYKPEDIAPMFKQRSNNVILPKSFILCLQN